jgi:hypothetical protein
MNRSVGKGAIAAALVAVSAATAGAPADYRVRAESVRVETAARQTVTAEAHYPVPPDTVWNLLNFFTQFPSFVPRVKACESLGTVHGLEQIFVEFDLPLPFPNIWNIISLRRDAAKRRFEWEMVKGNLNLNQGFLTLDPEGQGTALQTEFQFDPGGIVPGFVVRWAIENFFPKVLRSIGDRLRAPPPGAPAGGLREAKPGV